MSNHASNMTIPYTDHLQRLLHLARQMMSDHHVEHLLIHSGIQQFFYGDDQFIPWRMHAAFRHFIDEDVGPYAVLVISQQHIVAHLYQPNDYWYAPPHMAQGIWTQSIEVQIYHTLDSLQQAITSIPCASAAWLGDQDHALVYNAAHHNPAWLLSQTDEWRVQKSAFEVEKMHRASEQAVTGHRAAAAAFLQGKSEFDIHLAYLAATQLAEEALPYHNIVAINQHAAILHYQYLDRQVPNMRYSFLLDAGGNCDGYASDITRTIAGPDAPSEFVALIQHMHQLKNHCNAYCVAGRPYMDVHLYAHQCLANVLLESELVQGISAEAVVQTGLSRVFFPHGIGHLLGLTVHDAGGFQTATGQTLARSSTDPALRLLRTLEANMTLTIEPGLYFIDALLNKALSQPIAQHINLALVNQLKPCGGIRVEDNLLITHNSPINFTALAWDK